MEFIGVLWNEAIIRPMINSLVLLYFIFFNNFGLSIIVFTIVMRGAMFPLSLKQSRQMKAMSSLQPKVKELQVKYPNDRSRVSQETMRLYKEHGVSPLGCLGPMVVQMPIFFGLFWALRGTLPSTPERLADLAEKLYSWLPPVNNVVPLDGTFLWLDLAKFSSQNPVPLLLPVLVGVSMWLMQKMTATPSTSAQQESTAKLMLWMMPLMFGFFTLSFETGLALYWIVSNIVGIVTQGLVSGWEPITSLSKWRPAAAPAPAPALVQPAEEATSSENHRDDREDTRRSNRARPKGARRRAKGRRNRRH